MNIIFHWIVSALAIIIAAYLLPGVAISGLIAALIVAVVLGIINVFIKPIIILLTLPINILTLGLFTLVINAALIMLASSIVPGFVVDGFWWAFVFAIVLWMINSVFHSMGSTSDPVTN
ncbi:MAG: phage holin family protein [Patescibacteria group bacterium]